MERFNTQYSMIPQAEGAFWTAVLFGLAVLSLLLLIAAAPVIALYMLWTRLRPGGLSLNDRLKQSAGSVTQDPTAEANRIALR